MARQPAVAGGRLVRPGGSARLLYTIGYEKRTGPELIELLAGAGVAVLADIRAKPFSRVPAFRRGALCSLCAAAGIVYQGWPGLGATEAQRKRLKETGDFAAFARSFRRHAAAHMAEDLAALAAEVKRHAVALLCYERAHEECHRSIIAERLAEETGCGIVAL